MIHPLMAQAVGQSCGSVSDFFHDQLQNALGPAYRLVRELEGGGMSRVYLAREQALDRDVVVKVLPPELAAGVNRERFRREIQLAAQLQHPHIVPLLSAGESGDILYYTMPFIAGESLKSALASRGRLPVREVVRILHDVVDALAYAHDRGIIHRDIKPANVLMSGSHAVITDFGVAKAISDALPLSGVTTAGVAIGTPAYMAPEQLAADPAADHRVDLYAVGLLAYELLSGESPFTGPSPAATMAAQLTRVPERLDVSRPDVPADLSAVIMRCLEKHPEARPASARELLAELDRVSLPHGVVLAGAGEAAADGRQRGVSRRYVALLSILLTLAIGSALALTWNRRGAIDRTTRPGVQIADTSVGVSLPVEPAGAQATPASPLAPPAMSPGLTPADSLAIARAIESRAAQQRSSMEAGNTDSLRQELRRALEDSMNLMRAEIYRSILDSVRREIDSVQRRRASGARVSERTWQSLERSMERLRTLPGSPPMTIQVAPAGPGIRVATGPVLVVDSAAAKRVAISSEFLNATRNPAADKMMTRAAAELRERIANTGEFKVVAAEAATDRGRVDPWVAAQRSNSAIAMMGLLMRSRGDSAYIQVHVVDMRYGHVFRAFRGPRVPISDPLAGSDKLWTEIIEWLRRPPPPPRTAPVPKPRATPPG